MQQAIAHQSDTPEAPLTDNDQIQTGSEGEMRIRQEDP
jgi:hypothetical protein